MKALLELKEDLKARVEDMQALLKTAEDEDRPLTETEKTNFDRQEKAAEDLKKRIKAREEHDERSAKYAAAEEHLKQLETRVTTAQTPNGEFKTKPDGSGQFDSERDFSSRPRYGKLRAFSNTPIGREHAYRAGMWCRAVLWDDEKAKHWCRANGIGFALGEGTNTAGGFLVPDEMNQAIIDLREQYGVFRQYTRIVPMGSETMSIPRRSSGVTATFTGESAALTESDPAWNQVNLTAKKTGVLTRISSELAQDAVIDIGDWVAQEMAYAFANQEDTVGFTGDGTSTHGGIYGITTKIIDGNHAAGAVDAASGIDTFAEVTIDDLTTLMAALPAYADRGARWFCSKPCQNLVFDAIAAAGGGNTITDLAGSTGRSFLGYPIIISQVLPTSTGDLSNLAMFLFGDLSLSSTMGTRREIRVMTSDQRYFENDQIAIKATTRFDIVNHDLGDGTTAGPIVAMVGE